jgi:beta-xylosidase
MEETVSCSAYAGTVVTSASSIATPWKNLCSVTASGLDVELVWDTEIPY